MVKRGESASLTVRYGTSVNVLGEWQRLWLTEVLQQASRSLPEWTTSVTKTSFFFSLKATLLQDNLHKINCTHSKCTVQWVLTNAYALITSGSVKLQHPSITQKMSFSALCGQSHCWAPGLLSVYINFAPSIISCSLLSLAFHFSMTPPRPTHVVGVSSLPLLVAD